MLRQTIKVEKADLPFAKALIKADHGTIVSETADNGTVTLVVDYPRPALHP